MPATGDGSVARGRFFVLEGVDGAGTTTQAALLRERLVRRGLRVHTTREPSDGPIGALLRDILKGRVTASRVAGGPPDPVGGRSVALLFAADRLEHLASEIDPLLARGVHVVSDRYLMSSLAYQSADAPLDWVRTLNRYAPSPDLTVLLRVRPAVAMARIERTRDELDRFEKRAVLEHVAKMYERLAGELPAGENAVVDGEAAPDAIADLIEALVAPHLASE